MSYRSLPIRIFLILAILLQATFGFIKWLELTRDPRLNRIDFVIFYTAGRIARSGDYSHLYDLQTQKEFQNKLLPADTFAGGLIPFNHPPYLTPLLAVIAGDDYIKSYFLWTGILVAVLIICCAAIYRLLQSESWGWDTAILTAANCILFYPVLLSILKGQDAAFILLGLLFWMIGLRKGKEMVSGFGLALATLIPQIAGALALPTISSGRRSGLWFCMIFFLLALYSLILIGFNGVFDFLHLLLISSQGQGYALNQSEMINLIGLMLRSFPTLNVDTIHKIAWTVTILSIIFVTWLWWGKQHTIRIEHIGLAVVLAIFTSPHLHSHSLSFLLIPLIGTSIYLWNDGRRGAQLAAVLVIPLTSLVMEACTLAGDTGFYASAYLLMAALFCWFLYLLFVNSRKVQIV